MGSIVRWQLEIPNDYWTCSLSNIVWINKEADAKKNKRD